MKIYLAAIIGFWVLTNSYVAATLSPGLPPIVKDQADATQSDSERGTPQASQETGPEKTVPKKSGAERSAPGQTSQAPTEPSPPLTQEQTPPASTKKPESTAKTPVKKARRKKHVASKPAVTGKKVVKNGGTADPAAQLAPGVSNEQASRQRKSTTELLAATDANLKQLASRQLNKTQQDSVSQIRKYMEQAKTAEEAGDVQRAQNLASKALMLSDDLVKH